MRKFRFYYKKDVKHQVTIILETVIYGFTEESCIGKFRKLHPNCIIIQYVEEFNG